jgi:hypothetical protein
MAAHLGRPVIEACMKNFVEARYRVPESLPEYLPLFQIIWWKILQQYGLETKGRRVYLILKNSFSLLHSYHYRRLSQHFLVASQVSNICLKTPKQVLSEAIQLHPSGAGSKVGT